VVAAAALAAEGHISTALALLAVGIGIYAGDLALFACGRSSRHAPVLARWLSRRWSPQRLESIATALDRRLALVVLASRFVPGSRLPTYLAAGLLSRRPLAFLGWTLLAVALWTPLLMAGVFWLGTSVVVSAHAWAQWVLLATALVGAQLLLKYWSGDRQ
jgi:membrane protein DedA with SNARE-associated domain